MLLIFPSAVLAGTATIIAGSSFSQKEISLNVGDSIVWEFQSKDLHSATLVDRDCRPVPNGFDSRAQKAPMAFYNTFREAGTYQVASVVDGDCSKGYRMTVVVNNFPVNQWAAQKWQRYSKKQLERNAAIAQIPSTLLGVAVFILLV